MAKIYRHGNLSFSAGKEEEVKLTIQVISNGTEAKSTVTFQTETDPRFKIDNAGSVVLGILGEIGPQISIYSAVNCPIPQGDNIVIRYLINDQLIVEHSNPKSEEDRPNIFVTIKFTVK